MQGADILEPFLQALPTFAVVALTPLLMLALSRASAPRHVGDIRRRWLIKRNGWIDVVSFVLTIASACSPLFLFAELPSHDPLGLWVIGLQFGLMVIIPFVWICVATLPFGEGRFREFWLYYEVRWGVGAVGVGVLAIPLAIIGIISGLRLWMALG